MKIGEALNRRKYLMNHIPQIVSQLQKCITVEKDAVLNKAEATAPELYAALFSESEELRSLIVRINLTNNITVLPGGKDGMTVMVAISMREYLKGMHDRLVALSAHVRPRTEKDRYGTSTEKTVYVVAEGIHPANIKEQINNTARDWRAIDTALQQANWTVDLVG